MMIFFKIINEGIAQAVQQLLGNKLRSLLSLIGISIGIFCIIGVLSAVDSLESNVRGSFDKLGEDVVYIQKFTWGDPGENWRRYLKRPNISYNDFEVVKKKVKTYEMMSYSVYIGNKTLKYRSSSVEGVEYQAISYDFAEMFNFQFEQGRYFSPAEYTMGSNKVVLGSKVAEELFGSLDPIGKTIRIGGRKLEVIGVLIREGESLVNIFNYDEAAIISYELARKITNLKPNSPFGNSSVNVKAAAGIPLSELKGDVTGVLRSHRRLKPRQEDDFSLNTLSIISNALTGFFGVVNMLGWVIGIFAILVGGVSVANIMFVSVKERTNIIGVKKALGAKRYIILLEFLIESIILCIFGGLMGLGLVYLGVTILSQVIEFELFLSIGNMIMGVFLSVIVGIIAGLIPAIQASAMDPVEAMRH